jgi:hypothetical protein
MDLETLKRDYEAILAELVRIMEGRPLSDDPELEVVDDG